MPILVVEKDISHELSQLPGSVRAVLKEAARLELIPSATRLFAVPGLDSTIEEMTNFVHGITAQGMTDCANQGVPEEGLLVMRNSCIVAFAKACEAGILVFNNNIPDVKIDIMLDPRRCEIPDVTEILFLPEPTQEIRDLLATLWCEFDTDTTLGKDVLRRIGAASGFGACLFFAHRDLMFHMQGTAALPESDVQSEMRATLEYTLKVGISFTLQHDLRLLDDPIHTTKIDLRRAAASKKKLWWFWE
jgi:hypothetical protein